MNLFVCLQHSGSTGSANSGEISLGGSQSSQSSLMKGLALTTPSVTPNRAKTSAKELKARPVPEGTEV